MPAAAHTAGIFYHLYQRRMEQFAISQSSFDQFLGVLDSNRDRAGQKYEALRLRVVKFFEWRACRFPDDLADKTLDRVIQKVGSGAAIEDHVNYTYGVARFIYLEHLKRQPKEEIATDEMADLHAPADDEGDERFECLEACLKQLAPNSRTIILEYYRDDRQAKIDLRKQLADKLRISANALRIKALRIRTTLEACVLKCMEKGSAA